MIFKKTERATRDELIMHIEELQKELKRQANTREIEEKFIEKNFISKNKIREKIKEAEGYLDNAKENIVIKEYELVIEFLEELLEE